MNTPEQNRKIRDMSEEELNALIAEQSKPENLPKSWALSEEIMRVHGGGERAKKLRNKGMRYRRPKNAGM